MGNSKTEAIIHETARVDEGAQIGAGTRVWHFSHIREQACIGCNCVLGQNVYVDPNVKIGNGVKIENNVSIYTGVEIEDYVFLGPSMVFTNVINPRAHIERKTEFRPTIVRRGATIGANATVVCGVVIGQFAFVAAGCVVNRDVPAFALMTSVPARQSGWMCQCGVRLEFEGERSQCTDCGAEYKSHGKGSIEMIKKPERNSLPE